MAPLPIRLRPAEALHQLRDSGLDRARHDRSLRLRRWRRRRATPAQTPRQHREHQREGGRQPHPRTERRQNMQGIGQRHRKRRHEPSPAPGDAGGNAPPEAPDGIPRRDGRHGDAVLTARLAQEPLHCVEAPRLSGSDRGDDRPTLRRQHRQPNRAARRVLHRIVDVKQRHVVPHLNVAHVLWHVVVDEVGDHEHDEASTTQGLDGVERRSRVGLAARLRGLPHDARETSQGTKQLTLAGNRPRHVVHPIREREKAETIARIEGRDGDGRRRLDGQLELAPVLPARVHRRTRVKRDEDLALPLLQVGPHVGHTQPRRHLPVDVANRVADHVATRLVKLHPATPGSRSRSCPRAWR